MTGTLITASYPAGLQLTNANYTYVSIASTVVIGNPSGIALFSAGTIDLTLANSGTVDATGSTTGSYGVVLGGSGTITNTAGGLISGFYSGVLANAVGTVVNQGSITEHSSARGAGVVLVGGGGVTNDSVISGVEDGVHIEATGQVTNSGTISGADGNGVIITGTGGIVNDTLSTIAGYRMGVTLGANGTVINQGSILSTQTSGRGAYYNTATQVLTFYNVGLWANSGGIDNAAGAVVSSNFFGVVIAGGGSVANQGSINGSSTTIGVGIFLFNGGTITNSASATITGGFEAIVAQGTSAATIVNNGMIEGQGRAGVDLLGGGYFGNTGTVIGPGNAAVHLNLGGSIHNTGSLGGGIYSVLVGQPATVDNLGVMTATQTMAGGVVALREGGTIINEASGTLSGKWKGAEIFSYTTGSAPGAVLNSGLILAADAAGDGAGAWMRGPGLISNAASGTISGGAFGVVTYSYTDTVVNQGTIFGTRYAVDMGDQATAGIANRLIVSPGASFSGTVSGDPASVAAASALELTAGTGVGSIGGFGSKYVGFSQVTLDAGASWSLAGTVVAGETLSFAGDGGLTLANPGSVAGTITGFGSGDTLVLAGMTDVTSAMLGLGNLLTVNRSGGPSIALQFAPSQTFFGNNFPFTVVGSDTNLVAPACFAAGTRIATPAGEVPVETLRAGDRVILARGGTAPVIWLGHRHIDCGAQGVPSLVQPVCIRAGALAAGLPARDLWLSPDHAVHVDGALIPARHLVNGRSVVQLTVDSVTYFHVELPRHEVILAEGLAVESYLDTGNRSAFANAAQTAEHGGRRDFSG
jgi:hypothetical protein